MVDKFLDILKLGRFNNSIGSFLLFYTASSGLLINLRKKEELIWLILFFIGSVFMRSAGSIINDIIDRDLDKQVERTKFRPLASGKLSLKAALITTFILISASFLIFLKLQTKAQIICLIALVFVILYPFTKRITYFPQVFLGVCFSLSSLVGYYQIDNNLGNISYLFLGNVFWVIGYDTIYGFQDLRDDKKANIKSLACLLENKNPKIWLFTFYSIFIISLLKSIGHIHLLSYILIICAYIILIWQVLSLDIYNRNNCYIRFMSNNHVGFTILAALLFNFFTYNNA